MPTIDIALLPDQISGRHYGHAVIVDVLRATTTMVSMLDAGAIGVVPAAEVDDARQIAGVLPGVLLAGERGGLAPEGFDLGNSPLPAGLGAVDGRAVVLSTTNGTRAVGHARACADTVFALALTNLDAVVERLIESKGDTVIVCSGTDGSRSVEDEFAAGMLAAQLADRGWGMSERASEVVVSFESLLGEAQGVAGAVLSSPHAQRLIGVGFAEDVAFCSRVSISGTVPKLCGSTEGDPLGGLDRFVMT